MPVLCVCVCVCMCVCVYCVHVLQVRDVKLDTVTIIRILDDAEPTIPARELAQFKALSQPLRAFAQRWSKGAVGVNRDGLVDLLRRFLLVESHFGGGGRERRFDDVLFELRQSG